MVDEVHPALALCLASAIDPGKLGTAGDDGVEELDEHGIASEYLRRDRLPGRQRAGESADDGFRGESREKNCSGVSRVT